VNLPNWLTVGRIIVTPLIAALPFFPTAPARLWAFLLFLACVQTDWLDGYLARKHKLETDLGKMLDPLADKLLLFGTFIPMFWLAKTMPFQTPFVGEVGLPLWVVVVVLGREITMTWFRQYASRRGVIIAAIASAKWKTSVGGVWQGAAYCWFWFATLRTEANVAPMWNWVDPALGAIGAASLTLTFALTVYSLVIYARDYGRLLGTKPKAGA